MALLPYAPALAHHPRPTSPKLLVCLYHYYDLTLSTTQEVLFENFKPIIGALVANKFPVDPFFRLK